MEVSLSSTQEARPMGLQGGVGTTNGLGVENVKSATCATGARDVRVTELLFGQQHCVCLRVCKIPRALPAW